MPGPARQHENGGRSDEEVLELRGDRRDPFAARRATRAFLDGRVDPPMCDDVLLVVSELVTNAVVHAGTDLTVRLQISSSRLRVEVTDTAAQLPVMRDLDHVAERGRGMRIIARVADRWGVEPVGDRGKTVWAELARR